MKKQLLGLAALAVTAWGLNAQTVSSFEETRLPAQGFLNGKRVTTVGSVVSGGVTFSNRFDNGFQFWAGGFAVSNQRNDTTPGYTNLYAAVTASGFNSQNYAVGQDGAKVKVPANKNVSGVYVTNSTYAYQSMKQGDQFAKKFGGSTGNDPDYFELEVTGYSNGALQDTSVVFMLADLRFADNMQDYIVNQWTWVDLTALKDADSLVFSLSSSDTGQFGMNTPAYFAIDDFSVTDTTTQAVAKATFEDIQLALDGYWNGEPKPVAGGFNSGIAFFNNSYNTTYNYWSAGFALSNVTDTITAGYTNQNAAITGGGYQSSQYAVAGSNARIRFTGSIAKRTVQGFYITNSTYAYLSMQTGDQFAKKFGGVSGNDPDYFEIVIKGYNNGSINDSVIAVLADFRSANNAEDYILKTWKWIDLTSLGMVDSISFSYRSSDVGQFGMNTPAYFCIDNFSVLPVLGTGNANAFICAGKTMDLSYTVSEVLNAGNIFTAQLSDATGSFAFPVNVGTLAATDTGKIEVTIPGNTVAGAGYKLRVVSSNPAVTAAESNSFTVGMKPVIVSVSGDSLPFKDETKTYTVTANTGSTYVWSFTQGSGTSTTNSINITWNETGTITLKVVETSSEGCASDTATKSITINNPVGLSEAVNTLNATVYPNPASTLVNVNLPAGVNQVVISLFDITGKQVLNQQGIAPVNVQNLDRGVYMMVISAGGKTATKRVVIN
jgi:hypothetical protein